MSKIADVVRQAAGHVPAGYTDKVDSVVSSLEGLAAQIADTLVDKGVEFGGDRDTLDALMVEVGLREPEPEPEQTEQADEGQTGGIAALEARIAALEAAAARHGVRV